MDLVKLRQILHVHISRPSGHFTHDTIPAICERLGLPVPDEEGTKAERMKRALDAQPDGSLRRTAELYLEHHALDARQRNTLQDLIWEDLPTPRLTKRTRRKVARALNSEPLFLDARRFDELLDRLWVLDNGLELFDAFFGGKPSPSLRELIDRHVHRNPEDWSAEQLFEEIGAFDCSDKRFALFLEGLASAGTDHRKRASFDRLERATFGISFLV